MFSRVVHGIAVLLALLPAVLADRAFAQSQPGPGANEAATFDSRFSAVNDLPQRPARPPTASDPAEHSMQMPAPEEPFGLKVESVTTGEVLNKWNGLVADIQAESEILGELPQRRAALPACRKKIPQRDRRRPRA